MKMDTHDRVYSCSITRQPRAVPGSVVQRQRGELAAWANDVGEQHGTPQPDLGTNQRERP